MSFKKTPYQYYPVNNLASGAEHKEAVVGNFIILLNYTGVSDDVYVSFGDESYQILPKGIAVKLPPEEEFKKIRFKQLSGATQSFAFAVTTGEVYDSRLVLSVASLDVNTSSNAVESPDAYAADETPAIAVAADSEVREVVLQNNGDEDIWLGDEDIDPATSRGYKLEAGVSTVWTCAGDVYAACASGLTSTLSIVKLKKV